MIGHTDPSMQNKLQTFKHSFFRTLWPVSTKTGIILVRVESKFAFSGPELTKKVACNMIFLAKLVIVGS